MGGETLPLAFGERVPFGDGFLTPDLMAHGVFPAYLQSKPADILVMRYGGADYLLGTPLERFASLYTQAVRVAQGVGCIVVLAGLYEHPKFPDLADFDAAAARVALETGAVWVDLRKSVPVQFPQDFADDLHGNQQTSDRWMAAIAESIKGLA